MSLFVESSRFKIIPVGPSRQCIRDFVAKKDLHFAPGKGFYQVVKPETIQVYKTILVRRKDDGVIISGDPVRPILGIPDGTKGKHRIDLKKIPDFDVFVQSTSFNRMLDANTDFLYDTDATAVVARHSRHFGALDPDVCPAFNKKIKKSFPKHKIPPPPGPPGSPIEIVFSFDTTGSMYQYLEVVRSQVSEIISRLLDDIPTLKIAVIAHGDYCDARKYVTKRIDFTNNKKKLVDFVNKVEPTGGGDAPECYELVLSEVRRELGWSGGTMRSLVMIGDDKPHEPDEKQNEYGIDWREECRLLKEQLGLRIYSVQCNEDADGEIFFKALSRKTGGKYLKLENISAMVDLFMAICYKEFGDEYLQNFKEEIQKREIKRGNPGLNSTLHNLFESLMDPVTKSSTDTSPVVDISMLGIPSEGASKKGGRKRKADVLESSVKKSLVKTGKIISAKKSSVTSGRGAAKLSKLSVDATPTKKTKLTLVTTKATKPATAIGRATKPKVSVKVGKAKVIKGKVAKPKATGRKAVIAKVPATKVAKSKVTVKSGTTAKGAKAKVVLKASERKPPAIKACCMEKKATSSGKTTARGKKIATDKAVRFEMGSGKKPSSSAIDESLVRKKKVSSTSVNVKTKGVGKVVKKEKTDVVKGVPKRSKATGVTRKSPGKAAASKTASGGNKLTPTKKVTGSKKVEKSSSVGSKKGKITKKKEASKAKRK